MNFTKIAATTVAGLLLAGFAAGVLADTSLTADQAVAQRQAAMKSDGRSLRGSTDLTGDKAIAVLTTVQANYTKLPSLFPPNSITGKSIAKPIIWQQFDQFSAIFKQGADAAADGIAAVKAGNMDKYKADIQTIASTCNECHDTYRSSNGG